VPEPWLDLLSLRTTPPAVPPGFLERPRLDEQLTVATSRPLTLLCAGPGHGKTLTLASWIKHRSGGNVGWLSLDETDNDPQGFWFDLLGALTITGAIPPDNPLRDLIPAVRFDLQATRLISAGLAALSEPMVLVLDDFHAITDSRVLRSFERLVDHQPPQLRIVLATRSDPALRLIRRRVAGELTDIRDGDLAFTAAETGKFLAGIGIHLTAAQLDALMERTQGWAAGLRLAVLSLDADEIDSAISRFTGSDGLVAEYLIEEVLDRVPATDRHFLLTTSVVERVSSELARHLTGRSDSRQVLERLVAQNALLLGLAGGMEWFTFHPMLRELLQRRLALEKPDAVRELHELAAQWFGAGRDPIEAIRHACLAQDWVLVGHLLATRAWPLALTPRGPALSAALEPATAMVPSGPTVHTLLAAAVRHYQRHEFPSMRRRCDAAAQLISDVPAADRTAVECLIGTLRVAHSRTWDPADTEGASTRLLGLLNRPAERPFPTAEHHRIIATNNLAVSRVWTGRLDEATPMLFAVQAQCRDLGMGLTELSAHGHLALLDVIYGRLPEAADRAGAALNAAARRGWASEPQVLGLRAAIAMVYLERAQFERAKSVIDDGLLVPGDGTDIACRLVLAIAAVVNSIANGDEVAVAEAALCLDTLQRQAGGLPPLLAGWCSATQTAADLSAGRAADAIERVRAMGPAFGFPDTLGRLVVAKARLLLDQPESTVDVLHPLLCAAPRFRGPAVEARILAAVAADRMHRDRAALTALTEAISLAHGVGMIRPFLTAGPEVAGLLGRHRRVVGRHFEFTGKLTAAIAGEGSPSRGSARLLEPLTGREMAVLVYLPTMLKSTEIAADLFLSVNTVKTHQRAIYRKLGVGNRREAVDQARACNLLEQPDRTRLARRHDTS